MRCVSCGCVRHAIAAVLLGALAGGSLTGPARAAEAQGWDAASSLASSPEPPGLRLVWNESTSDPAAALDRLERAGFDVAVALPPHAYYVRREGPGRAFLPAGFSFQDGERAASLRAMTGPSGAPEQLIQAPGGMDPDPFQGREDALPPVSPASRVSAALRARAPRAAALQGLGLDSFPGERRHDRSQPV